MLWGLVQAINMVNTLYNTSFVYCRELVPGTVSVIGDWIRGEGSKQYRYNDSHCDMLKLAINFHIIAFYVQYIILARKPNPTADQSLKNAVMQIAFCFIYNI